MASHLCATLAVLVALCELGAALSGPFVLWGPTQLQHTKVGPIQQLDDESLRGIYAQAETIVVFVRNASLGPIRAELYPAFGALLLKQSWAYLPQRTLSLDPLDFSGNAEIISLVGSTGQQDVEISALFNDAVNTYGPGKVLGILGNDGDSLVVQQPARRQRREAATTATETVATGAGSTTTEEPSGPTATPTDEPMEENFVYIAPGRAMMYTTAPPQLSDGVTAVELREHGVVASDERKDELVRFIVTFKVPRNGDVRKLILRFRFPISGGYWTLTSVELEEGDSRTELLVVGEPPSAPLGFSYKCARSIQFRLNSTTLTLEKIQVQPVLVEPRAFSDAYDCVGFTTGGILSGLFISTLLLSVIFLGLACITDIKTPTKYENSRGKTLTFSAQE